MRKIDRNVKLRVEELESRVVPSAGTPWPYPTANWSGYSIDTAPGGVTDVKGSWNVPSVTVNGSGTKYAASWLGIDGDISNTVEQIGTDSDQVGGKPAYYAWYEMYPSNFYYIDWATQTGLPASAKVPTASLVGVNDTMSADVQFLSSSGSVSTFKLTITDTPAAGGLARTFTTTQTIRSAAQSSAEWIVEQTGPLTAFSPETFTGVQATISGTTANVGAFLKGNSSTVVYKIDIVNNRGAYLDSTGELNSAGTSFTVNDGTTQPPPPNGPLTHGPLERLADVQVSAAAAPSGIGSSQADGEIPAATAIVEPGFRTISTLATGTHGRFDVVGAGVVIGEGNPGTGLSWIALTPNSGIAIPPAGMRGNGDARFVSTAERFGTVWATSEQPATASAPTLVFSQNVRVDRLAAALALVAFLPGLQASKANEKRGLPNGNGRPE